MPGKIREFVRNMRIQYKLMFSTIVLILAPVIFIAAYFTSVSINIIKKNNQEYVLDTMIQTGKNIDNAVENMNHILFNIATGKEFQSNVSHLDNAENELDYNQTVNNLKNIMFENSINMDKIQAVFLVTEAGNTVSIQSGLDDFFYRFPKELAYGGKGSTIWLDDSANEDNVTVIKAVIDLNRQIPLGYVVMVVDSSYFLDPLREINFTSAENLLLINQAGEAVIHTSPLCENSEVMGMFRDAAATGRRYDFYEANANGRLHTFSYSSLKNADWILAGISPVASRNPEIHNVLVTAVILSVLVCAFVTLLSHFISRRLSGSIEQLCELFVSFSKGDFTVRAPVHSRDEIGILSCSFNTMVTDMDNLMNKVHQEKNLKLKAQLKALQMQINPHFLYNTLDTINWLSVIKDVPEISEMTQNLAKLMRYSISDGAYVLVEKEFEAVNNYKAIQKYRMPDLEIHVDIDEELLCEVMPRQIMLPIIENAIEHGLSKKMRGGKVIHVGGYMEDGVIHLVVEDNGVGIPQERMEQIFGESSENTSIGLRNVHQRIRLHYGDAYGVAIQSQERSGTRVTISFPQETCAK